MSKYGLNAYMHWNWEVDQEVKIQFLCIRTGNPKMNGPIPSVRFEQSPSDRWFIQTG